MTKPHRMFLIFSIILVQSVVVVLGSFFVVSIVYENRIASNVYVNDTNIGGLTKEKVLEKLHNAFDGEFDNQSIILLIDGKNKHDISCNDIQLTLDYDAVMGNINKTNWFDNIVGIISCSKNSKESVLPKFKYNENNLRQYLNDISMLVDKEPINAKIMIENGEIKKIEEKSGLKLNIDNAVKKFEMELENFDFSVNFSSTDNFEIESVLPELTLEKVNEIEDIIAEYFYKVKNRDDMAEVISVARALNGTMVDYADVDFNNKKNHFSFNKHLKDEGIKKEGNNGVYNQVASALHAAVLAAGMDVDYITRSRHESFVDYIEPGLDVSVTEDGEDFTFANTSDGRIMILTEVCKDGVIIRILGRKSSKNERTEIETEIVQIYDPSIINFEDSNLQPGEKKIISPGKKGLKVAVYRLIYKDEMQIEREHLYTDIYKAVKSVVNIGPDTEWVRSTDK